MRSTALGVLYGAIGASPLARAREEGLPLEPPERVVELGVQVEL